MDNMLEHPGIELQVLIKEKGLTQKAFASILGKKVSEVNELLKGKRNITIQRDYLLHQTLGTPIKYWILKQIDYDYSLLDIEETDNLPSGTTVRSADSGEDSNGKMDESNTKDSSSQAPQNDNITETRHSERGEESMNTDMSFGTEGRILDNNKQNIQETPTKNPNSKDDEDLQNRAKIFRSF